MSVVYKYEFTSGAPIVIPFFQSRVVHAGIAAVAHQNKFPTIWVEHSEPPKDFGDKRKFRLVGTGERFDTNEYEHVGSAICGRYVWHVYGARTMTMREET